MPGVTLAISHTLGQEEATRRLKERFSQVRETFGSQVSDLQEEWNGDSLKFCFKTYGMKIQGTVSSAPSEVHVDARLPLSAMMFKGTIEQQIRGELSRILA
jgi:hypothetical protein